MILLLTKLAAKVAFAAGIASVAIGAAAIDRNALIEAARREGKVTWYAQPGFKDTLADALAEWRRRYPEIRLEVVEGLGPETLERVRAERRAARPMADVVTLGDVPTYEFLKDDAYAPFKPQDLPNFSRLSPRLKFLLDERNRYLPLVLYAYGINVNTRLLKQADWPRSWKQLLEPRYKNKLALSDISRIGGGFTWLTVGRQPLGDAYFHEIAAQSPRVYGRAQELDAAVVRGERAISIPGRSRVAKDYGGAPIQWIVPEEGAFFVAITAGVLQNAPNPHAALLLLDFLLEETTQKGFAAVGDIPVVSGVPSQVDLDKVKFLGQGFPTNGDFAASQTNLEFGRKVLAH